MAMTLKALRVNYGLTQKQAGEKVGVSEETWANWENAKTFPDVLKIQKIEKSFNISYNDISFLPSFTVKP